MRKENNVSYIFAGLGVMIAVIFVFSMVKAGDCDEMFPQQGLIVGTVTVDCFCLFMEYAAYNLTNE